MAEASFKLDFRWHIGEGGYRWITTRTLQSDTEEMFLTDGIPVGGRVSGLRYFPLHAHSGLFRDFVATPLTQEAIKVFADRYGMLGGSATQVIVIAKSGANISLGNGESFRSWRQAIADLRRCVQLYDWIRATDIASLKRHIIWTETSVQYESQPGWKAGDAMPEEGVVSARIATRLDANDIFDGLTPGDVVTPALFHIQREINKRLLEETSLSIRWEANRTRLINCATAKSLLGAMWLQFSLAIERGSEFRQCAQCGTWFEVSPKTARSDKQFCSTACRVKAFRQRKSASRPAQKRSDGSVAKATTARGRKRSPHSGSGE